MLYARAWADAAGASHIDDLEIAFAPRDYAPPAPPFDLSPVTPATGFAFARFPAGWFGDWHPTPCRQVFFILEGEMEDEASDGGRRQYGPGDAALLEDTAGIGHRSRVVGDADVLCAVVQLPD